MMYYLSKQLHWILGMSAVNLGECCMINNNKKKILCRRKTIDEESPTNIGHKQLKKGNATAWTKATNIEKTPNSGRSSKQLWKTSRNKPNKGLSWVFAMGILSIGFANVICQRDSVVCDCFICDTLLGLHMVVNLGLVRSKWPKN